MKKSKFDKLIALQKKDFKDKFCSFYGVHVIVGGILQGDEYLHLNTKNGNDILDWYNNSVSELFNKLCE